MKRHAGVPLIVLILLIVCAAGALVWMARSMVPEPFVVTLPRVGVDGNKMVDGENNIVTLRGVSIADPYYLDHYDHHFSEEIFAELSTWNINVVRVPIHPGWWQAEEDYARKYLDPVVSWGKKYEFYIVLDWHAIGDPLTGEAQNPEWKEEGYTVYNPSLELAGNAWTELAKRYGENSWVIFELFNEPTSWWRTVDWESWGDEITKLVDKIRSYAPDTLILVSGWRWTNDLGGFLEYPIERANIAYVAHVYPDSQEKRFDFLSGAHPVVVTEWGFSPADPTKHFYGSREGFGQPFLEYLESENLSWVAWVFHPIWGPNMIKDWGYELTEQGNLVKQVLTPDNTPPPYLSEPPPMAALSREA